MPTIGRVLETSLYVEQLPRSVDFYRRVFGFEALLADDRLCAFSVSAQQVLLIFRKGASTKPIAIPGGIIPACDGDGQSHLAFAIAAEDEHEWTEHLGQCGVEIESRVQWERGGFSLYFRDPDGHLLELVSPGCWAIY